MFSYGEGTESGLSWNWQSPKPYLSSISNSSVQPSVEVEIKQATPPPDSPPPPPPIGKESISKAKISTIWTICTPFLAKRKALIFNIDNDMLEFAYQFQFCYNESSNS